MGARSGNPRRRDRKTSPPDPRTWKKRLKAHACENRKHPTPVENLRWQSLRGSKLGVQFRR